MNALRKIAVGSLAAVLACSMAACGSSNANSTDSASNAGKTVKVDEKSAKALRSPISAAWTASWPLPKRKARST